MSTHPPPKHYAPGSLQTYTHHAFNPSSSNAIWILYIHGGAWRDPSKSSAQIQPAAQALRNNPETETRNLAGILSINYRLSPYPTHATLPSAPTDAQRNVQHPSHVRDVAAAVAFLRREYGVRRWVGVGHSCGATMLLQFVSGIGLDGRDHEGENAADRLDGLEALVLLEGIYDIPILLRNHEPPRCGEDIAGIYRAFINGAFGEDRPGAGEVGARRKSVYESVSPTNGVYSREQWKGGRLVVVGYSDEDTLVESEQGEVLVERLREQGWSDEGAAGDRVVEAKGLKGDHDDVWRNGKQVADLILEVVKRLSR
ncbi:alpha/beta-hydrolase [Byssothecium circinans]|uniref:Kynurenine formamidase n=1 Tax=Byssothecium circinans TaxID=147558 RepID=A0A6A5TKI7_9PLEO|nr:alpha/beta-hydrolase [Byssothecium circinans]